MSIRYPNEVTIESQTKKANERLARYQLQLDTIKKLLPIVKEYDGKQISKRIATAFQKACPNDRIWFSHQYGMFHIEFIAEKQGLNDKISILLGYDSQGATQEIASVFSYEAFLRYNQCFLLNEERIPRLKAGFAKIPDLIKKRNEGIKILQEMTEEAEKYEMDYDFDVEK